VVSEDCPDAPSDGYDAPKTFSIAFPGQIQGCGCDRPASHHVPPGVVSHATQGEAIGSIVHELVHVAQQYRRARAPGWLVEGIPD